MNFEQNSLRIGKYHEARISLTLKKLSCFSNHTYLEEICFDKIRNLLLFLVVCRFLVDEMDVEMYLEMYLFHVAAGLLVTISPISTFPLLL